MMYTLDIISAIFVMTTGFAASWVSVEIARLAGWREPAMNEVSGSPVRIGVQLALTAMIGPRLLLLNGFRDGFRHRVFPGVSKPCHAETVM